jgi:GMP synthase (glutamine-hydrolysing)
MNNGIIILDFGSQYNQLIARRVRELGVYSEVLPFNTPLAEILNKKPVGIILSGGPSSVNAEDAHLVEKSLFEADSSSWNLLRNAINHSRFGRKSKKGVKGEYGKANLHIDKTSKLFEGVSTDSIVWMSHFDEVEVVPEGFEINAKTDVISAISNEAQNIYCVQFHPEVSHSEEGSKMLENFVFGICKAEKNWKLTNYIEKTVAEIREKVGKDKVILGFLVV